MHLDSIAPTLSRRQLLRWLRALPAASIGGLAMAEAPLSSAAASASGAPVTVLAACWEQANAFHVGLLVADAAARGEPLRERASLTLPTRAHGLWVEPDGSVLVVARRPGDWLLRWHPDGRPPQWQWIEPQRAFNGHAVVSADGLTVYTTETNLDTGAGCIGVRDARTLAKRDEWPTHGVDAHQLTWDRTQPRCLLVANGGVSTTPETGRAKLGLAQMDSSLVRIDARSGRLDGQWRLADPRLSLRHLAWSGEGSQMLGIAMQAEHDDAEAKSAAPVLALFDNDFLRTVPTPAAQATTVAQTLAGYGGDIAALGGGFVVSCPRAQGLAHYSAQGQWRGFTPLPEACALAAAGERLWSGGRPHVATLSATSDGAAAIQLDASGRRLDNHWVVNASA